jgi:hypothetical protein
MHFGVPRGVDLFMHLSTVPAFAAVLALTCGLAAAEEFAVALKPGEPLEVPFSTFTSDCLPEGAVQARITLEPEHGAATVTREMTTLDGRICTGRKVKATMFRYVPAKGFRGYDRVTIKVGRYVDTSQRQMYWSEYDLYIKVE